MVLFVVASLALATGATVAAHCTPDMSCWPRPREWDSFGATLKGRLNKLHSEDLDLEQIMKCQNASKDIFDGKPFEQQSERTGMCLFNMNCFSKNCSQLPCQNTPQGWICGHDFPSYEPNFPSYAVTAADVNDIVAALAFANKHNIAVTVRVHGHSYTGSSTGYGTLLIWMHNFTKYGDIQGSFVDTCGQAHGPSLKIGGGQTWKEAYEAAGEQYEIGGGFCHSVAAAGGWLMGGGLSSNFHRKNGLGIDNVLQFEVVLANGSFVQVDACSHKDLWWALRGGGGGSFGVVTAAHYLLRPSAPFTAYSMHFEEGYNKKLQSAWGHFWAEESPQLDRRWNGGFSEHSWQGLFHGRSEDANATFFTKLDDWKAALPLDAEPWKVIIQQFGPFPNFFTYFKLADAFIPPTWWSLYKAANHSNWLVPHDWVVANPKEAAEIITDSIDTDTYWMGGAIRDVKIHETAVNPATRKAVWNIITADKEYAESLRALLPESGSEYNHASAQEPNYRYTFWGSNYPRLREIKITYDPEQRFKCQNCVDHVPADPSLLPVIV